MDLGLKGKVALVAASSTGLGKAVAMEFASEGANLAMCARHERVLLTAAQEIGTATGVDIMALPTDLTKASDIDSLIEKTVARFGRIDILINNAGGPPTGTFESLGDEEWAKAVELNLFSTVRLSRAALPYLKKSNGGRIINIVSMSVKQPIDGLILSNAVRASVIGLAKTMSTEFGKYNITVNNVLPGWTATERVGEVMKSRAARENRSEAEIRDEIEKLVPLGRMGTPEELAATVVFLASSRASYITGTSLLVDGGWYKGIM